MKIGPSFASELHAAGCDGWPFTWTGDGLANVDGLTPDQAAAVRIVLARHDPTQPAPPPPATASNPDLLDMVNGLKTQIGPVLAALKRAKLLP